MKTIIISDTHLTRKFNPRAYTFLAELIQSADKVVINGDLWEGWKISFDDFISSDWNKLFPLLKEKSAVYLYGNHDPEDMADERVKLFSVEQGDRHVHEAGGKTFIIEHGDEFELAYKKFAMTKLGIALARNRLSVFVSNQFERQLVKLNLYKQFYARVGMNKAIKRRVLPRLQPHEVYICGHSHDPEYDPEHGFINSGFIRYGRAHYVVIDDQNVVLKKARYTKRQLRRRLSRRGALAAR